MFGKVIGELQEERMATKNLLKKTVAIVLSVMLVFCFSSFAFADDLDIAAAPVHIWDGSADTSWFSGAGTYHITTPEQLAGMWKLHAQNEETFKGTTILIDNDLYLNANSEDYLSWGKSAPENEWDPIGYKMTSLKDFAADIDGQGHTIYGMYVNALKSDRVEYGGVFGYYSGGSVKNLNVSQSYVIGEGYKGAALLIGAVEGTYVENCSTSGYVLSNGYGAGGIAGTMGINHKNSVIENCTSDATVDANNISYAGGILGEISNYAGTVEECTFTGKVINGSYAVGGIVGDDDPVESFAKSYVNYNTCSGLVCGKSCVGGIIGDTAIKGSEVTNNTFDGVILHDSGKDINQIVGKDLYKTGAVDDNYDDGKILTSGKTISKGGVKYKIKSVKLDGTAKVEVSGLSKTSVKSITIPKSVLYRDVLKCSIKSIGKSAFSSKSLKTIEIEATGISAVSKDAFKGLSTSATIKVPSSKKSAYTKLFKKSGMSSSIKVKTL